MKKYRKLAELLADDTLSHKPPGLVKELLYSVLLVESNYSDDENAVVILLDNEQGLIDVFNIYQFLNDMVPEIDETTVCDGGIGYRLILWITGQDGSGIIALWEFEHGI